MILILIQGKLFGFIEGGLSKKHTLTPVSGTFIGKKRIALKLKKGVLNSGAHYRFKLTVTDADGTAAANTFDLLTNSVPSKGKRVIRCDLLLY